MVQDVRKNHKNQVARAIARGESITAWAHRNGVPLHRGFLWSRDSKVRRVVEARATRRAKTAGEWRKSKPFAVGGWGRAGIASESPERRPRTWGRRPSVADPGHPGLLPTFEPVPKTAGEWRESKPFAVGRKLMGGSKIRPTRAVLAAKNEAILHNFFILKPVCRFVLASLALLWRAVYVICVSRYRSSKKSQRGRFVNPLARARWREPGMCNCVETSRSSSRVVEPPRDWRTNPSSLLEVQPWPASGICLDTSESTSR